MEPIIKIKNLSVIYNLGKTTEFKALDNVNLEIYPQEYIIFFGPSGCGKSTLLYAIAGIESATNGEVWVNGKNIANLSLKEIVEFRRYDQGMVFQAYYLISTLNVLDNVVLPQMFCKIRPHQRIARAKELLERFGLKDFIKRLPSALSGGQQQRVAITRALVNDPMILFADEPVGNLDSKSAETFMNLIEELNSKYKKTIVLVTHDPSYLHFAHRVFYMRDGRVIRETVNPEKQILVSDRKKQLNGLLTDLAIKYPQLDEAKLKAKALTQFLLSPLDDSLVERLEDALAKRIDNKISDREFYKLLDLPPEDSGVGLYKQTARNFSQQIEAILTEAQFLQFLQTEFIETPALSVEDQKAQELRRFALDQCGGILNFHQIEHLDHFIKLRLMNKITRPQFVKYLDAPLASGGAGLTRAKARKITRLLDVALISS